MSLPQSQPTLDPAACLARQHRLCQILAQRNLPAAVLTDRRHVHYFTGHWHTHPMAGVALFLAADGDTLLLTPDNASKVTTVTTAEAYPANKLCTVLDQPTADMTRQLLPRLQGLGKVGVDLGLLPVAAALVTQLDLVPDLLQLRRTKAPDELAMIRHAIRGAEATYPAARALLRPGVTEIAVYAAMYAAAVEGIGEGLSVFGNDFQAGTPGGPPRHRGVESGELMPLDISVGYRGYWSDMSRTFSVDGQTTPAQRQAHARILEAFAYMEAELKPGKSAHALFDEVHAMLDGFQGWKFFHHLGHGIGLQGHETPRINPNFDDVFQVGDVITCEPGLYGADLAGGMRLEENYHIVDGGCERLTSYPLDL